MEEKREKKMEGKSRRGEEEKMGWDGGCKNNGSQHGRLSRLYGSTRTPVLKTWVLFVLLFGHESFFFLIHASFFMVTKAAFYLYHHSTNQNQ